MMQSSTSMRSTVSSILGIHGPVIFISLFLTGYRSRYFYACLRTAAGNWSIYII